MITERKLEKFKLRLSVPFINNSANLSHQLTKPSPQLTIKKRCQNNPRKKFQNRFLGKERNIKHRIISQKVLMMAFHQLRRKRQREKNTDRRLIISKTCHLMIT